MGHFNQHLRDLVLIFVDEADFGRDKDVSGILDALVTEDILVIEGKGANAFQAKNHLHVVMASHRDWIVPASTNARRYFVLDISDDHMGDHPYFEAISKQMECGGYEAMLHELTTRDIGGFNVRDIPETEGLQAQKKHSLTAAQAWLAQVLARGYIYESRYQIEWFAEWHSAFAKKLTYASYLDFLAKMRRHDREAPLSYEMFGKFLAERSGRMAALSS